MASSGKAAAMGFVPILLIALAFGTYVNFALSPPAGISSTSNIEQTSTTYSTISPSGLQLQIVLNATDIEPGGALTTRVFLYNTLGTNLSLTPDFSTNPNISKWDSYDSICGLSPVYHTFSFALYQGHYTVENISQAAAPLFLIPPVAVDCPNPFYAQGYIQKIEFAPDIDVATLSANASFSDVFKASTIRMEVNATTGSCNTEPYGVTVTETSNGTLSTYSTEEPSFGCGSGSALYGYWTMPTNRTCSAASNANSTSDLSNLYCNFHPFPVGSYTIVAEDLWNQTVYAYFQVALQSSPVKVVSVVGPIPPYNPGGPVISITLMNVADLPITSLNATFELSSQLSNPYSFVFAVNSSNPLFPGQSIQDMRTLIGAGFDSNQIYPLMINGMLSNGSEFSYAQQVQITAPD